MVVYEELTDEQAAKEEMEDLVSRYWELGLTTNDLLSLFEEVVEEFLERD